MGNPNRGKKFEAQIQKSFENVPNTSVIRLNDPVGFNKGVRNICDYIVYHYPHQYFIECKCTHDNVFSIYSNDEQHRYGKVSNTQWEGMLKEAQKNGVIAGIMLWFIKHDRTIFISIEKLQYLYDLGLKSVRWDIPEDERVIEVDGKKKTIYYDYNMKKYFKRVGDLYE